MSRYFTTTPPVYARNWANGQNLVESTKMERQIVPKKVHRKEKKEKKEKKRVKNEKSLKQQYLLPTKQFSDESEQLEKSCLTEEHVGYLSDGSQSSKKRRCKTSPTVVQSSQVKATPVAGNPLRIRFVFKKPKEAEVVPQEDRVCSTSGTERPVEVPNTVSVPKTCDNDLNLVSSSIESNRIALPSETKKRKKHRPSKESRYNSLFDEWVPPSILLKEDDSNSEDWLFGTKHREHASTKVPIKNDEDMIKNLPTSGDCSFFPRARFLPEVGIFSLPYTVLF